MDNRQNRRLERGRQSRPCLDYVRQIAPIIALSLCAYLCIGRFRILWKLLIYRSLRSLRGRFDSLHPLQCLQGFSHFRRFLHQFCISLLPTA